MSSFAVRWTVSYLCGVRLPDGINLSLPPHCIYDNMYGWFEFLDPADKSVAHPGTFSSAIESGTSLLQRDAFEINPKNSQ